MLTLAPEKTQPLAELAAGLTDQALEILGRVGIRGDSVETELKLWRALTDELAQEPQVHNGAVKRVVYRAAMRVISDRPRPSTIRPPRPVRHAGQLCGV